MDLFVRLAIFSLIYAIALYLGLELAVGPQKISMFWIANSIGIFALIKAIRPQWPLFIAMMSLLYVVILNATGDYPTLLITGFLAANVIEVVLAAELFKRFFGDSLVGHENH